MPPTIVNDGAVHTSDRLLFKRCRRKWGWSSRIRMGLVPKESRPNPNFWFGTGWHFAMEDYHGYRKFPTMAAALEAYVSAHMEAQKPYDWDDYLTLGKGMADYYTRYWLPRHRDFRTLWLREGDTKPRKAGDGIPQLEVEFSLQIPGRKDKAPFAGTFDGIMIDDYGRWWVKEIKTAKRIDIGKLDTDPQISAYCLAAEQHYQHEFEGVVYLQFLKGVPQEPKVLKAAKGKDAVKDAEFSVDMSQKTTYDVYRAAVIKRYGSIPDKYQDFLGVLQDQETQEGNKFIRVDMVTRNSSMVNNEIWKLQAEARDMLDPELPLYPNPTYMCSSDCEFKAACLAMDDGSDWESILEADFEPRHEAFDWRERLVLPEPEIPNKV